MTCHACGAATEPSTIGEHNLWERCVECGAEQEAEHRDANLIARLLRWVLTGRRTPLVIEVLDEDEADALGGMLTDDEQRLVQFIWGREENTI